jgi:S1-C subfamily serine protease
MELRQQNRTNWVLNIVMILAAGGFASYLLWQMLMPNVGDIAQRVTVRIDGGNTGSGVMIQHQGDRYFVLSNWHVVNPGGMPKPSAALTIQTVDGNRYLAPAVKIVRVPQLDLAILEFKSQSRYLVATLGNSAGLKAGETLYVAGWADPNSQLPDRVYHFLVGNLAGRIEHPRDGYALVYTVSALPGMSGGPVLDRRGKLVGIHGRAIADLRTGTVNSVLGIDINRYLQVRGVGCGLWGVVRPADRQECGGN